VNLIPVIARLRDAVPILLLVGGAAKFEQALAGLTTLPAAFVLPATETGGPSPYMDQTVEQAIAAEFAVLIAVRNLADDEGEAAVGSLQPVREAVRQALLNWAPAIDYDGCEFRAGELLAFDNGVLWWTDRYGTAYLIRSAP
jgi:hypothetical protein